MVPRLIGFHGAAGSGKSYACNKLTSITYKHVMQYAFADPLKMACMELFNLTQQDVFSEAGKAKTTQWRWDHLHEGIAQGRTGFMTVREILQHVGTDLVRKCWCEDHWIRLMANRIENTPSNAAYIGIHDVRFANEAECIKAKGGIIISLYGRKNKSVGTHASETQEITPDYTLYNPEGTSPIELCGRLEEIILDKWGTI